MIDYLIWFFLMIRRTVVTVEHRPTIAGDITLEIDAGQADALRECPVTDAHDRQAIERAGDGHVTAGTAMPLDGDGAVVVDVIKLRLNNDGGVGEDCQPEGGNSQTKSGFHKSFGSRS